MGPLTTYFQVRSRLIVFEPFLKPFLEPAPLSWKLEHTFGIEKTQGGLNGEFLY